MTAQPRTPITWWRRIHPGRNPLARTSDRVETALVIGVVLVALLALPVAAALGSDAYADRMRQVTEQAADRRPVTARLLADAPPLAIRIDGTPFREKSAIPARWTADGVIREVPINVENGALAGDEVTIWLDFAGEVVAAPVTPDDAAGTGVGVGVGVWLVSAAALAGMFLFARSMLGRRRDAAWTREWRRASDDWTTA
ncbi:hypothetical protein [Amycolatopsis sp. lyj-108]|uniref:Rv1733c family protein n=1 Tax=Amycolatopsis sp. lyj-108 TaxID=2789286 RepID=UPI00397D2AF0